MVSPKPLKVILLLASLALAGSGIAMISAARNSQVRKLTPLPGVAPAGSETTMTAPGAPAQPAPAPTAKPKRTAEAIPEDIQWRKSFQLAIDEGRASGKPVMTVFYTDWCGFCKKLDTDVFSDFGIISESVNFVSVKINAEKNAKLAAKYQVSSFPTIIWLDSSGVPLETLNSYVNASEYLQMMRKAQSRMPAPAA